MDEWKKSMRNAYSRKSETDVINEVMKIKAILDDDKSITTTHSWALFNKLLPLQLMGLSPNALRTTGIAYSVFRFHNHHHKPVKNIVTTILEQWKWPVVADGTKNMPSTKKNRPLVRILYKKVQVGSDKENIITRDPNIPQQEEVKTCMGVADRERMIQINLKKPNIPAKLREGEVNLKRKPLNMTINEKKLDKTSGGSIEEKMVATKRKLYQSYKEAEEAKKKRRIQVIEFHELGKQGLLPKAIKPHNTLIKKLRSNNGQHCRKTLCY